MGNARARTYEVLEDLVVLEDREVVDSPMAWLVLHFVSQSSKHSRESYQVEGLEALVDQEVVDFPKVWSHEMVVTAVRFPMVYLVLYLVSQFF